MRCLVVGCGYSGEKLADLLHEAGHEVTGLTHSPESAERLSSAKPYPVLSADVSEEASLREVAASLSGVPDAVIHCASSNRGGADMYRKVYLEGCTHLTALFPKAHLLFTSSTSVYPQVDGSLVDESSPAEPERETGRILRQTEDLVLAHGGTVTRLAGIYGPGRSFVLKNFLEGKASIEGAEGQGRVLNQIHRDDVAGALMHLLVGGHRGVYNVVDDLPMTQRECFKHLAARFARPMPPVAPPNNERKRAWTNKRVSNAALHATGFTLSYPTYFDALDQDAALVPSILTELGLPVTSARRGRNIIIVGLMGSGKSTVGRMAAHSLGFGFVDTDQIIIEKARKTIPDIFAAEGEAGFRQRETDALKSLLGKEGLVIATGGGIVTQAANLPILKQLGYVVWLNADPNTLYQRTVHSNDRPLLRNQDPAATLRHLYETRRPMYQKACDLQIGTDDLTAQDVAYGLAESVRVYFRG